MLFIAIMDLMVCQFTDVQIFLALILNVLNILFHKVILFFGKQIKKRQI